MGFEVCRTPLSDGCCSTERSESGRGETSFDVVRLITTVSWIINRPEARPRHRPRSVPADCAECLSLTRSDAFSRRPGDKTITQRRALRNRERTLRELALRASAAYPFADKSSPSPWRVREHDHSQLHSIFEGLKTDSKSGPQISVEFRNANQNQCN